MEDQSMVEVFPCEAGSVKHRHIAAIHTWNNAMGCKFFLDSVKQVSTINAFNDFIMENIEDTLEDGSYLLSIKN